MERLDPALEWQRLTEYYRKISDGELLSLAQNYSDLTEIAQQVMTRELSSRKVEIPVADGNPDIPPSSPTMDDDPDSPYAEDRKLVDIATVWSLRDAVQLQEILTEAGLPLSMGIESV